MGMVASEIKEGVTTLYLDKLAQEFIRDHGAEPSLGYMVSKFTL
jgi:methionyl aminopeptidase